MWITRLVSNRK